MNGVIKVFSEFYKRKHLRLQHYIGNVGETTTDTRHLICHIDGGRNLLNLYQEGLINLGSAGVHPTI